MGLNYAEDYYIRKLFEKATIKEMMNADVVTIFEKDTLSHVQRNFIEGSIHVLLVDKNRKLTGLISPKYLYKTIAPKKFVHKDMEAEVKKSQYIIVDGNSYYTEEELNSYLLTGIMLPDPFTLEPDDKVSEGMLQMVRRNISCIPIVDAKGTIHGVFTIQEIVSFLIRTLTE